MVTNLLNKNDLGLNQILKQTALAIRTDVSSRRCFSSPINYVKIEHSRWEFRGVQISEADLEVSTNVLVKEHEHELGNYLFTEREKFSVQKTNVFDTINCLTLNFDPSNDLRSADCMKFALKEIKNTSSDFFRLHAIITTPNGYEVMRSDDGLELEFSNGRLFIRVEVSLCNDATSETYENETFENANINFTGEIVVNNGESASSLDISRVDFILIGPQQMAMLQEVDQIHDMKSFVEEQNNKK